MKRRSFIKVSGTGAGAIILGSTISEFLLSCTKTSTINNSFVTNGQPVSVIENNFSTALNIPITVGSNASLIPQNTTAVIGGNSLQVLGYQSNGILGPTIRINKGENVNIQVQNNLSVPTNIHWHGLEIPVNMDGHPSNVINASGNFNYKYAVTQRASLSWYHPHPDGYTASQVFKGLAGMFLINDSEEAALNLPSGENEIPLVIQDKRFSSTEIVYSPTMMDTMNGYQGDKILVNGVIAPFKEVSTRYYRLRILNGSNSRIYNLAFSNNLDFTILGNDGGLLKSPITVKSILLAPGERLDVLVNFASSTIGSEIFLQSNMFSTAGSMQGNQSFNILKFVVTKLVTDTFSVPTKLSEITTIAESSAIKARVFTITSMQMQSGMMGQNGGGHKINGKVYDKNRIDEYVTANTIEIWTFDNSQGMEPHPMHIHASHFQILDRTGGRNQLIASESGWKDTVLVMPGEKVRVIVPFSNLTGTFVFHCHNLEHEENGMMLQFQVS
jgi:blue copper oxidase